MASARRLVVLITGGNAGIGFEAAKQLVQQGHSVVLACRDEARAQAASESLRQLGNQVPPTSRGYILVDVASLDSVRSGAAAFLQQHPDGLDVLCCNAGILAQKFRRSTDGYESMLATNHLGHFLLVHLLLPALLKAPSGEARVVMVSSELHRRLGSVPPKAEYLAQLGPGDPFPAMQLYGLTKLYNIWFTRQLAEILRDVHVTANAVTPGFVPTTGMSRDASWLGQWAMRTLMPLMPFAVSLREGGRCVSAVCAGEDEGQARGAYYSKGRLTQTSAASRDVAEAQKLWEWSLRAAGVQSYLPP